MTLRSDIAPGKAALANALVICSVALFYSLYIWFDIPLTDSVVWLFTTIYSLAVFPDKKAVILAWNVCLGVVMLLVVNLSSAVTLTLSNTNWERLMEPSPLRVAYILWTNIAAAIVLYMMI